MQKSFLIFDEDFSIGTIRNTTFSDYTTLKGFSPGSMTSAHLYVQVQLRPNDTSWGLFGRDEFEVAVWMNNTSGDPAVDVWLKNKEYSKIASAPVNPIYGDNTFTLRIDKGHNEGGHTKGHVKVWLIVEYSDPKNPPGGSEPVNIISKITQWVSEHPVESAVIGVAGLFAYDQYSGGAVRQTVSKGVEVAKTGVGAAKGAGQIVINVIGSEETKQALGKAKTVTTKVAGKTIKTAKTVKELIRKKGGE